MLLIDVRLSCKWNRGIVLVWVPFECILAGGVWDMRTGVN